MEIPVQSIEIQNFPLWFENKLLKKYELTLLPLKTSFFAFYNIIKSMIQIALELNEFISSINK